MTPFGWTVAAFFGAIALLAAALLIRWLRRLESERIEAIAARRGWTVDGGSGPNDWRVYGEDDGLRWVLGVRREPGREPATELTIVVAEASGALFAAPRAPASEGAEGWVADVFSVEVPGVAFLEALEGWTVATDDPAWGRTMLVEEEGSLEVLRPTLALHGQALRLRLADEVRDGPTLEALVDLGLRMAQR